MPLDEFYVKLKICDPKAAVLSIVSDYAAGKHVCMYVCVFYYTFIDFIPKSTSNELPTLLTSLYRKGNLDLPYTELIALCERVFLEIEESVSEEQAIALERTTRDQAKSKLWFKHRAGRVTASKFKAACSTDPHQPAQSLVKSICYPEAYKFDVEATRFVENFIQ